MKNRICLFPLLLLLLAQIRAIAQQDTEFWFVAPEVSKGITTTNYDQPVGFRFSTYSLPAVITLTQPANPTFSAQSFTIPANSTAAIQFPPNFNDVENQPPDVILNKGFHIESTSPVTAYYEVIGSPKDNPALFSLKGKNALGTEFYIPFQTALANSSDYSPEPHAAIDIVATEDNTLVTITPTQPIVGHPANVPFSITLQRGQTYSAQAESQAGPAHPSGSHVTATKPIAVTMKDDLVDGKLLFGGTCDDLMGDQVVPVERLGTQYVVQKGRLNGPERAYVVATAAGTLVYQDGVLKGTLNAGQTLELTISAMSHFVETSAPAYLLQMTGTNCELSAEILPSLNCSGSSSVRFVRSTSEGFYLFLVTKAGNEGGFTLNGSGSLILPGSFTPVPGTGGVYVAALLTLSTAQVPVGQSSVVSNSLGVFQMGFLNGGSSTGSRFGFFSDFGNKIQQSRSLVLCPGDSIFIAGTAYTAPGIAIETLPGVSGCDTVVTYTLALAPPAPAPDLGPDVVLCHDSTVVFDAGAGYAQYLWQDGSTGATLAASVPGVYWVEATDSCGIAQRDSVLLTVSLLPDTQFPDTVICPGVPVQYILPGFDTYAWAPATGLSCTNCATVTAQPAATTTYNVLATTATGCVLRDTFVVTVRMLSTPAPDLGPDIILCHDSTVVFDAGAGYVQYLWQDGSTGPTLAASVPGVYWVEATDSCGTKQRDSVLLTVSLLPDTQFPDTVICPGASIQYILPGFDTYAWAPATGLSCTNCATVTAQPAAATTYNVLATTATGCVLRDTFVVTVLPNPQRSETIEFCPGETVTIGGVPFTAPGTVSDTLPSVTGGCDTLVTYTLKFRSTANTSVSVDCIDDISIATLAGTGSVPVLYALPAASSTCPCPGVALTLTEGLPPGSLFPVAKTRVCYQAADSCGNTAACCFFVTVREALPCDSKQIGCMRYDLLQITQNTQSERTYRIQVTNTCANRMLYTAFQLPDGVTAVKPANNTVFSGQAPGNRTYEVRNPNATPFYSIRFRSLSDSLANGESDVFEYTLPPQSAPAYIHVTSRLEPQAFYEAYLNTFNCPVQPGHNKPAAKESPALQVYPNPTGGALYADLSAWQGQQLQILVLDSRGQCVWRQSVLADAAAQAVDLPGQLPGGLYFLEIRTPGGENAAAKFVLQR